MTFLFVLQYPGYLRYFDSVIRLLAERGHHVAVAYDSPHKQPEGGDALEAGLARVEQIGRTPTRGDVWGPVGRAVRGSIDYARYLHPDFVDAPYLRDRMRKALPGVAALLGRCTTASAATTMRLVNGLTALEHAIPSSPTIEHYLRTIAPDALVVSPLVTDRCPQADFVKSAKAIGLPVALCVASWDHLTTKGLVRVQPDLVTVWNAFQKAEAEKYHGVSSDRITVTGAQNFDRWFDRRPSRTREAFCARVGLRPDRPIVLFVGSTASISAPEAEVAFVRRWTLAVREHVAATVGDVSVLIRPHPYNSAHWGDVDVSDLADVAVYPRNGANPVNEDDRADYHDSLYHSAAVVGVNTSAMIEAAIVGRAVHTVIGGEFADTQGGTLHFRYLLPENGGCLKVATSMAEHVRQVEETLRNPAAVEAMLRRFVQAFIRPAGLDRPATPLLADALERLAQGGVRAPRRMAARHLLLRALLWMGGVVAVYRDPGRLQRAVRKALSIRKRQITRFLERRRRAAKPAKTKDRRP